MFPSDANRPDCWKCILHVEWHDCSWCPVIILRRGIEIRGGAAIRPRPAIAIGHIRSAGKIPPSP